jgi:hypothetical protein
MLLAEDLHVIIHVVCDIFISVTATNIANTLFQVESIASIFSQSLHPLKVL